MQELSRKEKIEKRIAELERQIYLKDNAFDKEQGKRCKRTFFVLCGVIYFVLFYFYLDSDISISNINFTIEGIFNLLFILTFGVGFVAGWIMFISYAVMSYIFAGAMKRAETIARLKAELETIKYFDTIYK